MTSKSKVLLALEGHRGEFLSGEAMAGELDISRAAVWKAVKELREEGCPIEAVTQKGYRIASDGDFLSAEGTERLLKGDHKIHFYREVSSTNSTLRELALAGAPAGTVVLADHQAAGRGRLGRSFFSPPSCGIYLSILLRPSRPAAELTLLTAAAAVAICRAIETVVGVQAEIKWVNDLFYGGKKVCGILTEAVTGLESGTLEYVVIGAGINAVLPEGGFPKELEKIAGALSPKPVGGLRNALAAEMIFQIETLAGELSEEKILPEYRSRSCVLGKEVQFVRNGETMTGRADQIADDGSLEVVLPDGSRLPLRAGEVSIRPADKK